MKKRPSIVLGIVGYPSFSTPAFDFQVPPTNVVGRIVFSGDVTHVGHPLVDDGAQPGLSRCLVGTSLPD